MGNLYAEDTQHLLDYISLATTEEGFCRYLEQFVFRRRAA
jgi:hypothetical protein